MSTSGNRHSRASSWDSLDYNAGGVRSLRTELGDIRLALDFVSNNLVSQQYQVSREFEERVRTVYDDVINDINTIRQKVNTLGDLFVPTEKFKSWVPMAPIRKECLRSIYEVERPRNLKSSKSVDFVDVNDNERVLLKYLDRHRSLASSRTSLSSTTSTGSRSVKVPGYGCCFKGDQTGSPAYVIRPKHPRHSWGPSRSGSGSDMDDVEYNYGAEVESADDLRMKVAPYMWEGLGTTRVSSDHLANVQHRLAREDELRQEIIAVHNEYRRRHGCPDLSESAELSRDAQQWAEVMAMKGYAQYSDSQSRGENILVRDINQDLRGRDIVDTWYRQCRLYNYKLARWQRGTSNFTQVIWKDSRKIGVGIAMFESQDTFVIVVQYWPRGNINLAGQFGHNVPVPLPLPLGGAVSRNPQEEIVCTSNGKVHEILPDAAVNTEKQNTKRLPGCSGKPSFKAGTIAQKSPMQSFNDCSQTAPCTAAITEQPSMQNSTDLYGQAIAIPALKTEMLSVQSPIDRFGQSVASITETPITQGSSAINSLPECLSNTADKAAVIIHKPTMCCSKECTEISADVADSGIGGMETDDRRPDKCICPEKMVEVFRKTNPNFMQLLNLEVEKPDGRLQETNSDTLPEINREKESCSKRHDIGTETEMPITRTLDTSGLSEKSRIYTPKLERSPIRTLDITFKIRPSCPNTNIGEDISLQIEQNKVSQSDKIKCEGVSRGGNGKVKHTSNEDTALKDNIVYQENKLQDQVVHQDSACVLSEAYQSPTEATSFKIDCDSNNTENGKHPNKIMSSGAIGQPEAGVQGKDSYFTSNLSNGHCNAESTLKLMGSQFGQVFVNGADLDSGLVGNIDEDLVDELVEGLLADYAGATTSAKTTSFQMEYKSVEPAEVEDTKESLRNETS